MSPVESATNAGTLYVVATPIGNLGDITRRAEAVLAEVRTVLAEDTRRARQLLSHLGVAGKAVARLDANATTRDVERAFERLQAGERVALLTDAGTPSVSDPGAALVRRCHDGGVKVVPIPGASAVTSAIAASGLVDGAFFFAGFLPRSGKKRQRWLDRIAHTEEAVVLFEAGNRARQTLSELAARQPERTLCVARELTKKFEQVELRPLSAWLLDLPEQKGELTLVLGPMKEAAAELDLAELDELVRRELGSGTSPRDIAQNHHQSLGLSRRELYQRVLSIRDGAE